MKKIIALFASTALIAFASIAQAAGWPPPPSSVCHMTVRNETTAGLSFSTSSSNGTAVSEQGGNPIPVSGVANFTGKLTAYSLAYYRVNLSAQNGSCQVSCSASDNTVTILSQSTPAICSASGSTITVA